MTSFDLNDLVLVVIWGVAFVLFAMGIHNGGQR